MNRERGLALIEETRIIAIARGVRESDIVPVAEALLNGGIRVMEVTLNTPGAANMIGLLQEKLGDAMYIGAGTVLDTDGLREALDAGASFIVTPNTDEDVIRQCAAAGVPIFPGALTPTEIVRAWKAGADAVKIFPSSSIGFDYIKELMGPLEHIPMIAVGGVNVDNIADFMRIGCYAVGIGNYVINRQEIASGNYAWIERQAEKLSGQIAAFAAGRNG